MKRREFLRKTGALSVGAVFKSSGFMRAEALELPLGLQLYSVREFLPKDYLGTHKQISALGYTEVEAAGFYDHSPAEVKQAMHEAGLRCVSAHYPATTLFPKVDETIAYGKELGLEWIVCSFPAIKNPERLKDQSYNTARRSFLLEDWRYNAEQFNLIGAKVKAAGMRFAYHNHTMEFRSTEEGVIPFQELATLTDPEKVWFELDTGWVVVGGGDPVDYLHRYANRVKMVHVKDFTAPAARGEEPKPVELGHGIVDVRRILAAAKGAKIVHCFVEQEGFTVPWIESLKIDAEFMRKA